MADELKPCPFCGGEAADSGKTHFYTKRPNAWWSDGTPVVDAFFCNCTRCGITNQNIVGGYQTKEKAIEAWNQRTESAQAAKYRACVEALRDAREVLDVGGARYILGVDEAMVLIKKIDSALAGLEG